MVILLGAFLGPHSISPRAPLESMPLKAMGSTFIKGAVGVAFIVIVNTVSSASPLEATPLSY